MEKFVLLREADSLREITRPNWSLLKKIDATSTNSKDESMQTILEVHYTGEQVTEMGQRELAVSANLSSRKL